MSFMPFQILAMWFRGFLAVALLASGGLLLYAWYANRQVYVSDPRSTLVESPRVATHPDDAPERPPFEVRRIDWEFGLNRETAYLLGGVALVAWGLGGRWLNPFRLRLPRGEVPRNATPGTVKRIKRPDGTELYVEIHGPEDGSPVILTHGWGLDSQEWTYTTTALAVRHRLIVWDLPGLGRSRSPLDKNWSLEKLAGDLEAVLALAEDRPAVLVGHSIGGMISLTFCRLFPEAIGHRVSGLILVNTTYTNPVKTTSRGALYTVLQKPVLEPLCHLMVWLAPFVWFMNWLSYLNGSAHRSTERSSFSGRESRGQLGFLSRYTVKAWPGVVARGLLAMFRYDATNVLGTIGIPTLIVTGDQDKTCIPEASDVMHRRIPHATLVALEPARHCGHFEHHTHFNSTVQQFIASCSESLVKTG